MLAGLCEREERSRSQIWRHFCRLFDLTQCAWCVPFTKRLFLAEVVNAVANFCMGLAKHLWVRKISDCLTWRHLEHLASWWFSNNGRALALLDLFTRWGLRDLGRPWRRGRVGSSLTCCTPEGSQRVLVGWIRIAYAHIRCGRHGCDVSHWLSATAGCVGEWERNE